MFQVQEENRETKAFSLQIFFSSFALSFVCQDKKKGTDSSQTPGLTSEFQGSMNFNPWYSTVYATVTMHEIFCILHLQAQDPTAFGPEMSQIVADVYKTRYSLLPYLYTLFHKSHMMGYTVVRSLFFE